MLTARRSPFCTAFEDSSRGIQSDIKINVAPEYHPYFSPVRFLENYNRSTRVRPRIPVYLIKTIMGLGRRFFCKAITYEGPQLLSPLSASGREKVQVTMCNPSDARLHQSLMSFAAKAQNMWHLSYVLTLKCTVPQTTRRSHWCSIDGS